MNALAFSPSPPLSVPLLGLPLSADPAMPAFEALFGGQLSGHVSPAPEAARPASFRATVDFAAATVAVFDRSDALLLQPSEAAMPSAPRSPAMTAIADDSA